MNPILQVLGFAFAIVGAAIQLDLARIARSGPDGLFHIFVAVILIAGGVLLLGQP